LRFSKYLFWKVKILFNLHFLQKRFGATIGQQQQAQLEAISKPCSDNGSVGTEVIRVGLRVAPIPPGTPPLSCAGFGRDRATVETAIRKFLQGK